MSQPIRRVLAVASLAAALLVSGPAPSRAAGLRGPVPAADFVTRSWSWLEGLLGSSGPAVSAQRLAAHGKVAVVAPPPPPPTGTGTGNGTGTQGSMIDPDGRAGH